MVKLKSGREVEIIPPKMRDKLKYNGFIRESSIKSGFDGTEGSFELFDTYLTTNFGLDLAMMATGLKEKDFEGYEVGEIIEIAVVYCGMMSPTEEQKKS